MGPEVQGSPAYMKHIRDFKLHCKQRCAAAWVLLWENWSLSHHLPVGVQEQSSHPQPQQGKHILFQKNKIKRHTVSNASPVDT